MVYEVRGTAGMLHNRGKTQHSCKVLPQCVCWRGEMFCNSAPGSPSLRDVSLYQHKNTTAASKLFFHFVVCQALLHQHPVSQSSMVELWSLCWPCDLSKQTLQSPSLHDGQAFNATADTPKPPRLVSSSTKRFICLQLFPSFFLFSLPWPNSLKKTFFPYLLFLKCSSILPALLFPISLREGGRRV